MSEERTEGGLAVPPGDQFNPGEPLFIVPPASAPEQAFLDIDQGLDEIVAGCEKMLKAVGFLEDHGVHPAQSTPLSEIKSILIEALIPYAQQATEQYKLLVED